jgi:uncharacterized protein
MTTTANIGSLQSCWLSLRRFTSPFFCASALFVATPVVAQAHLGPEATGGANYSVKVMSWADIPFRSIVRQRYDFSCGSAAVATLLTYHYQRPTSEQQSFSEMWKTGDRSIITKSGFSMFDMKNYIESVGFRAEGYRMSVDDLAKGDRPAIVLLDMNGFKHFVVVKGMKNNVVLVGDSIRGLTQFSAAEFQKSWNGIALAIVDNKDAAQPGYNLVRDWGPWSTAPVGANSQTATIGDVTTFLPPTYQLTPQILLTVRVGTVGE